MPADPYPECSAGAAATISKKQNKEFSLSAVHHGEGGEGWGVFPIFVHKQNKELVILNAKASRSTKYSQYICHICNRVYCVRQSRAMTL